MASKRDALVASAEKSIQKGKIDAALKDYLKVLEETPTDINVLNKVGDLYVRLNRPEESIPYFTKIAEHYAKDGFFLKAIAIWKRINKIDPSRLEVYERLAELYAKQGLGMEAKSQYQVLADYHTKQNNLTAAIAIYQKMVTGEPANIQLHVKLADLFTQARRVPEALKEYGVVAGMLRERGAFEESIQVYDKALKIAPDNLDILRTYVPLLTEAGRGELARAALRRGLETTPRSVPLFLMSAEGALAVNDMADARNFATKAQAVEPDNEDVLGVLVKIHLKGRRPDLAFSAAAPLADAAVRRGEAKKALTLLVPIAKAAPDNEDILAKIVDIAHAAGDELATVPYRSALAEIWRRQGKVVEAADALRICARLAPDIVEYRARLAQLEPLLPQAGRPPEAPTDQREITLSGIFPKPGGPGSPVAAPPRAAAPVPVAPRPARPAPPPPAAPLPPSAQVTQTSPAAPARPAPPPPPQFSAVPSPPVSTPSRTGPDSFEFDLADEDLVEEAPPSIVEPRAPIPSPPAPPRADVDARELTDPGLRAFPTPIPKPASEMWADAGGSSISAAEAMEDFEAKHLHAAPAPERAPSFDFTPPAEEAVEELSDSAEIPIVPAPPSASPARPPAPPSFASSAPAFDDLAFESGPMAPPPAPAPSFGSSFGSSLDSSPAMDDLGFGAVSLPSRYGVPAVPETPPPPPLQAALDDAAVEEALVEAEVFRKYGLLDKAVEQIKAAAKKQPEALKLRERLFELYVEQGKKGAARREAEFLRARYREEGREDRVRAIDALVGTEPVEPATTPSGVTSLPDFDLPRPTPSGTFKRVSAAEIQLPPGLAAKPKRKEPEPPPPRALESPAMEVPEVPQAVDLPEVPPSFAMPAAPPAPAPLPASAEVVDLGLGIEVAPLEAAPEPALPPTIEEMLEALEPIEAAPPLAPPAPAPPLPPSEPEPEPVVAAAPVAPPRAPAAPAPPPAPSAEELGEIDFCLEQGMVVDAAERLNSLEARFPDHPEIAARRARLEGTSAPVGEGAPALQEILSDDLESVLDAELGRALTDEMARDSGIVERPPAAEPASMPPVDESGLFSDEAEFFNFAEELQSEMKEPSGLPDQPDMGPSGEVSLEEIFREFKKGVEQQLSPEDYETHYNLGIAYKEMALTDEAIGEFQLAAKDPLHAVECCSMLGLCFLEKGLPQLAIKWYRKGLESPNIREDDRLGLLYDLANVYQDVGDRENAYKTFLEIYGSNAGYRDVGERLKDLATA